MLKLFVILILCLGCIFTTSFAQSDSHVYSTWEVLEIDTCASAWLIKRFVDSQAQFEFFPKGEIITEGTPFDTPEAQLRRKDNMSAFECIVNKYQIEDPGVKQIAQIIHDIEINYWGKKLRAESEELDKMIRDIISSSKNSRERLEKSFVVFDGLAEKLRRQ